MFQSPNISITQINIAPITPNVTLRAVPTRHPERSPGKPGRSRRAWCYEIAPKLSTAAIVIQDDGTAWMVVVVNYAGIGTFPGGFLKSLHALRLRPSTPLRCALGDMGGCALGDVWNCRDCTQGEVFQGDSFFK